MRRVRRRMSESRAASIYAYVESLSNGTKEVEQLFRDLLISVTNFFRDPEAFALLAAKVIPQSVRGQGRRTTPVRVWVPGCATGEEAYSLAILLREHMAHARRAAAGADLRHRHRRAGARQARAAGVYPGRRSPSDVSPERLRPLLRRATAAATGSPRSCATSACSRRTTCSRDPPFSRLDLVSCRNLLIYLSGSCRSG